MYSDFTFFQGNNVVITKIKRSRFINGEENLGKSTLTAMVQQYLE